MSRTMKDSGIPWIGEIPSHWRKELIGSCIKEVNNPNENNVEDNALQFKMGTIISKKGGDSKYHPETLEAYNIVQQGDIVLNGLNLSFDFISQRVGIVQEKGVITSAYLAVRPLNILNSEYLNYLFKAYDCCKALHSMGKGLRQTLGYKEFRRYYVIFPELKEQQAIADFLDKKCSEIDELISLQEKIIEELKAYKQSVITEAVTKGLNPDVPMKDSGILWIGKAPNNRSFIRLRFIFSIIGGNGFKDKYQGLNEGDYPFYKTSDINGNQAYIDVSSNYVNQDIVDAENYNIVPINAIIVSKIGAAMHKNHRKIATRQCCIDNNLEALVPIRNDNIKFLYYLMKIVDFDWFDNKGTIPSVNNNKLKDLFVPDIDISEQQAIADYLDKKCSEIDSLIALKQDKIEYLKEYKKSIIYEYTTGKKEVKL